MHVAFAIADGGPGGGLVRKPTKESDWREVPLIDSVRQAFVRQLARRREQTGLEPSSGEYVFAGDPSGTKLIRPDLLSDRLAVERGHSSITLQQDLRHYVATTMLDAGEVFATRTGVGHEYSDVACRSPRCRSASGRSPRSFFEGGG
jgi:integrase